MGWEVKDDQFFCNTSDTYFGPVLDASIWPDMDWGWNSRTELFYEMFSEFLAAQKFKRYGSVATDPRELTEKQLEKVVGAWEDEWLRIDNAVDTLVELAKSQKSDVFKVLEALCADKQTDFKPKKKAKRKAAKKS